MAAADRLIFRNESVTFNIDILEIFKKKIYDGFDTAHKVEPQMWREITRILNEATIEGISQSRLATTLEGSAPVLEGSPSSIPTHDEAFYQALRHSNEVFAAFKVHTFGKDMAAKLFDSDGKLKSFDQWTQDTMGITSHQVGSWLETEYNTAILRAHQAADWQEFVRNKDIFPNLRWLMTTSPDPEDTHKHYWMTGLTLPVDDPFWNKHYPGDHWNCKCSLESTDAPVHRPADIPEEKPAPGLDENPGKEGHIFTQSHPYFPKGCANCFANKSQGITNALQRIFLNSKELRCYSCELLNRSMKEGENNIRQLSDDKTPPHIETYSVEHNGMVLVSQYHGVNEKDENIRIAKYVADKFGKKVYLLPRLDPCNAIERELRNTLLPDGVLENKNPDFLIGGKLFDAKSMLMLDPNADIKKQSQAITNHIKSAKKQAENIILEIPEFVSHSRISNSIYGYLQQSSCDRIIIVKHGEKMYVYKKTQN